VKFSWFCLIFTNIWVSTISQGKVSAWNRCGRKIKTYVDGLCSWWQNYSGLAFCKSRGNSGVTASTSLHWKPQESSLWRWFILWANVTRDPGLPTCLVWGVGLAGCRFLCAGKYTALLTEHEWGGPQHPAHEGVKFPGSCSWLGERKGSLMVGYLCSCPGCAVTRHLEQ